MASNVGLGDKILVGISAVVGPILGPLGWNGQVMQGTEPGSQQAAWQALLALRPRLRRFACGLTGSLDEADDLVQAVYERAIERHWQWEPGTRLQSWVFKIAHSLWISRKRHAAVRAGAASRSIPIRWSAATASGRCRRG